MQTSIPEPAATAEAPAFGELLARFRSRFDRELADWIETKRRHTASEAPEAAELAEAVARLAGAGGKRLRPALVWFTAAACAEGAGGAPAEDATLPLALSTELLHTYLLLHDDIMDHAETRRGLPSAHAEFARRHGERGWRGDAGDFGVTAAILVGDLAHTWAHELVDDACRRLPAERGAAVERAFAATAQEVIAGQYLEIQLAQRGAGSAEELGRALRLKSGRYSVERPVQLGALAAGASTALLTPLATYGAALGEAFQLQDDVLGTFGDEGETGKPAAGDLEEGKFTFLVFHALDALPDAEAAALRHALGRPGLSDDEVLRLRSTIEESGALERVRGMIAERLDVARGALAEASPRLAGDGLAVLSGLVDYIAERRR